MTIEEIDIAFMSYVSLFNIDSAIEKNNDFLKLIPNNEKKGEV